MTAKVSVLKGRSTKVAGSSFMTSTSTSKAAAATGFLSKGQCTRRTNEKPDVPSMRALSSSEAGTRA